MFALLVRWMRIMVLTFALAGAAALHAKGRFLIAAAVAASGFVFALDVKQED